MADDWKHAAEIICLQMTLEEASSDFFCMNVFYSDSRPNHIVSHRQHIVFLTDPAFVKIALAYETDEEVRQIDPETIEVELTCYVWKAIDLILHGSYDDCATILRVLNIVGDFMEAIMGEEEALEKIRPEFGALIGHLTLNKEFGSFFDQGIVTRAEIYDRLMRWLGFVFCNAIIISEDAESNAL